MHKWYVGVECFKCGMYWQGIVHDLSKFSWTEFFGSAKYFQGDSTPIGAEKRERGYSLAWLNHKGRNKHHWEYWTDFYAGEIKPVEIPIKYIREMACDMVGAGKAYNNNTGGKWDRGEPLKYFRDRRDKFIMVAYSKAMLEAFLSCYKYNGVVDYKVSKIKP